MAEAARAASRGSTTNWGLALVVLVAGMFMSILDVSIVNVAIPAMQKEFGASTDDIQWVATAYSLALGVVVPLSAWLGERYGFRRVYVLALLGFAACSALCGMAWDLNSMIAFRILQAIPGGVLPVITLTMVYQIVPREKLGLAMGLYGIGIVFAPATGPTLGGYLVEYVDWRLIFYINVPVGMLGAVAAVLILPTFTQRPVGRFDLPGFLAVAVGLFALLLALSEGSDWGWTSYPVLILVTVGLLSLALFVVIELEVDHPLLDVRVFSSWAFSNSLLLIALLSVGMFGTLFYIPQFLQTTQALGAFDAGLVMIPQALVMGVMMPIAGRLYDKIGVRIPAAVGLTVVAIADWGLAGLTVDAPRDDMRWWLAALGLGMGLAMMPIMTSGIAALPPTHVSVGSAYNNVVQRTSAAMGLAALTALVTGWQTQVGADTAGTMRPDALAGAGAGGQAGSGSGGVLRMYEMSQQMQGQSFVTALDDLFLVCAVLALAGVALVLLRPGARTATAGAASPSSSPAEVPSADVPTVDAVPSEGTARTEDVPTPVAAVVTTPTEEPVVVLARAEDEVVGERRPDEPVPAGARVDAGGGPG